jgi:hypothetical protein
MEEDLVRLVDEGILALNRVSNNPTIGPPDNLRLNDPLEDYLTAEAMFNNAIKHSNAPNAKAYGNLAIAQYKMACILLKRLSEDPEIARKKFMESLSNTEMAVKLAPEEDDFFYFNLSAIEMKLGEISKGEERISWYEKAVDNALLNMLYRENPNKWDFYRAGKTHIILAGSIMEIQSNPKGLDLLELIDTGISYLNRITEKELDNWNLFWLAEAFYYKAYLSEDRTNTKTYLKQAHEFYNRSNNLVPNIDVQERVAKTKEMLLYLSDR